MTTDAPPPPDETSGGEGASEGGPKHKSGRPSRTGAAAAMVVASRVTPGGEVHDGEYVGDGPRPDEYESTKDRARAICDRVRARRGRPPELTPDLIERVVERVLDGSSPELALRAEGFDGSTYWDWRRKAKDALAKDPPEMTLHVEFSQAVDCAKGAFSQEAATWLWAQRSTPGGKTSASNVVFLLKCRDPEGHSDKQRVELTGQGGGPVALDLSKASDEQLERILAGDGAAASGGG